MAPGPTPVQTRGSRAVPGHGGLSSDVSQRGCGPRKGPRAAGTLRFMAYGTAHGTRGQAPIRQSGEARRAATGPDGARCPRPDPEPLSGITVQTLTNSRYFG